MTSALQKLAAETLAQFERRDGQGQWLIKDGIDNQWLITMCREAHDHANVPPDDWKFEFIIDALDRLAGYDDPELARAEIEPDVYTSDLLTWIASHLERPCYVDDALTTLGFRPSRSIVYYIGQGQRLEKQEVFDAVREALEARVAALGLDDSVN